ncbi:HAD family hydrolase [Streptomyces sp. NPDC002596]|uniref:HAD family hydrolase n=1 Tax=unclassified Streptomyces TaxID=2593676 RepID=UPI002E113E33|nr:HAD family hydrolase [Streptomyces sp. NBC_01320]
MGTMAPHPLTVGFDLDMTLIDSRPGIKAAYRALSAETGTPIDVDLVVSRLGPPVEHELANWYPAHAVAAAADRYREIYPAYAITPSPALPGARESVAAIRARGGRTIVVTAKHTPNARLHLAHLGIEPDEVIGSLWAERKGDALREHGAQVYVGDHTGDVRGARTADALSVGVTTGPCDADELREAGADVVLPDLTHFPAWLRTYPEPA